ncbi:UbiA family prenyltransferase [Pedobacter sp. SYSU D00535]|uniref:UbiA family prenyltransferase n=1 Tax=Pedobacter sp. SYSU D00535 TaxID=2810308 RepID=UPI001A964A75|nr:UbiA family prenyltransferase [Pedobacter sp. SYSU D00535]
MNFKNLYAYFNERFPIVNMALFAILFLTVYSVALHFETKNEASFSWVDGLGMVATIFFFFRLRFFDEIKDFKIDLINHPHRILQSGKVSLTHLRVVTTLGTAIELLWSALMGIPTLLAWLGAFAFSLLMRYEFFLSRVLNKNLLLYAISHMMVMPLVIFWIWTAYTTIAGTAYILLGLLSLFGGFSFELARKIHAPLAERETVDSYSKSLGYVPSILLVLLVVGGGIVVLFILLISMNSELWPFFLIAGLFLLTAALYLYLLFRPEEKKLRIAEVLVSLFMLFSYLSVIVEANF